MVRLQLRPPDRRPQPTLKVGLLAHVTSNIKAQPTLVPPHYVTYHTHILYKLVLIMETINVYDYLENDHTLINDLIDFNLDSSSVLDSISESSLYDEQNEQILHDRNTARHDVAPPNQVQIYIYLQCAPSFTSY